MSEADRMLRELGYRKHLINKWFLVYRSDEKDINFDKKNKTIIAEKELEYRSITIPELKAINKKCEELRMDNKLNTILYKYYEKQYLKYRKRVLSEKEARFESYKIRNDNHFICGIDNGTCFGEKCTRNFNKNGCMYLKNW